MLCGKNDPQHEMKLNTFDTAIRNALWDKDDEPSKMMRDPRMDEDNVPDDLKKIFNLPKDMSNYEIDFEQVRLVDASFKRRVPTWSGQEVLDLTLNIKKSKWVLAKCNKTRVWPKGLFYFIKRFRCILKNIIRFGLFDNFLTGCVLVNTVVMAMDSYDIKE